jgi:hypothetical protein
MMGPRTFKSASLSSSVKVEEAVETVINEEVLMEEVKSEGFCAFS